MSDSTHYLNSNSGSLCHHQSTLMKYCTFLYGWVGMDDHSQVKYLENIHSAATVAVAGGSRLIDQARFRQLLAQYDPYNLYAFKNKQFNPIRLKELLAFRGKAVRQMCGTNTRAAFLLGNGIVYHFGDNCSSINWPIELKLATRSLGNQLTAQPQTLPNVVWHLCASNSLFRLIDDKGVIYSSAETSDNVFAIANRTCNPANAKLFDAAEESMAALVERWDRSVYADLKRTIEIPLAKHGRAICIAATESYLLVLCQNCLGAQVILCFDFDALVYSVQLDVDARKRLISNIASAPGTISFNHRDFRIRSITCGRQIIAVLTTCGRVFVCDSEKCTEGDVKLAEIQDLRHIKIRQVSCGYDFLLMSTSESRNSGSGVLHGPCLFLGDIMLFTAILSSHNHMRNQAFDRGFCDCQIWCDEIPVQGSH